MTTKVGPDVILCHQAVELSWCMVDFFLLHLGIAYVGEIARPGVVKPRGRHVLRCLTRDILEPQEVIWKSPVEARWKASRRRNVINAEIRIASTMVTGHLAQPWLYEPTSPMSSSSTPTTHWI